MEKYTKYLIVVSGLNFLVYCLALYMDATWPNWLLCWVFEGKTISSSCRNGVVLLLCHISEVSSSKGSGEGNLYVANLASPGCRG